MVDAECGAARRDRRRDAGEVARHDIGVALDHDDAVRLRDVAPRQVEPVQHLRLAVDRRLGGVQVLRPLVVVEEAPSAEADGLAGDVADRPHQPTAEAIVDAAVALRHETGCRELIGREPSSLEVVGERVPALRREADAESPRRLGVEAALAEEPATDLGLWAAESLDEELGRRLVRGEKPRTVAVVGRLPAVFVVEFEGDASGESLDRLGERDVVHALQERVDVARLAAAEAVVVAELRAHVEARTALVVERAETLHRTDAGRFQADVLTDDVGDVRASLHLIDIALSNSARHAHILFVGSAESAGVTAARGVRTRPAPTGRSGLRPGRRRRACARRRRARRASLRRSPRRGAVRPSRGARRRAR